MATEVLDVPALMNPISVPRHVRMTDEELIRFSEENKPYRFERNKYGEITSMSPAGGLGSTHEIRTATTLYQWNEASRRGVVFGPNVGFNLPDGSTLAPDAAWLSKVRWDSLTPEQQAGFPPFCPEFLIEIRSHSDRRRPLEEKMQLWMSNGTQLAWLIDPVDANVTIYRPNQPTETLERPDVVVGHAPVAGFELRTTPLWPTL